MTTIARGLSADWLNGWLAAIGTSVLLPEVEVSWTDDAVPVARFRGVGDLADAVFAALPSVEDLEQTSIARSLLGRAKMGRKFGLDVWADRVAAERETGSGYLAASATDLVALKDDEPLPHAPFDPPMPKGITLADRVIACRGAIATSAQIQRSLDGMGTVVQQNGLGFDPRRIPTAVESSGKVYVDPVVETLAFVALPWFPVRGTGRGQVGRGRGWTNRTTQRGAFHWFAWRPWLDRWAIDALLDAVYAGETRHVTAMFEVVPYAPTGKADTTRAYASHRVR